MLHWFKRKNKSKPKPKLQERWDGKVRIEERLHGDNEITYAVQVWGPSGWEYDWSEKATFDDYETAETFAQSIYAKMIKSRRFVQQPNQMSEIEKLRKALVDTDADRRHEYNRAYPEIGWSISIDMARLEAIEVFKEEGLIPQDWEYPNE